MELVKVILPVFLLSVAYFLLFTAMLSPGSSQATPYASGLPSRSRREYDRECSPLSKGAVVGQQAIIGGKHLPDDRQS
jgi:hypothetical protein